MNELMDYSLAFHTSAHEGAKSLIQTVFPDLTGGALQNQLTKVFSTADLFSKSAILLMSRQS